MVHREVQKQLRIILDDTKESIIAKIGDVGADTALIACAYRTICGSPGVVFGSTLTCIMPKKTCLDIAVCNV